MARYYPFNREDIFPSFFANRIQDFLAGARTDLRLTEATATKVAVVPDPDMGVAAISIDGRWRFNDATVERAHPGGAKGTYVVWAVALDNDIDNEPDPFTDHTDYAFDLRITAGEDPSGAGVEVFQKIGEIDWSGAAIEAVRQTFGSVIGPQIADGALSSEAPSDITWTRAANGGLIAGFKANSVGPTELADNSVDTAALINLAVTTAKYAALSVTEEKLAADSVATAKIIDLAVTAAKLAVEAVTEGKLANLAVTAGKIANLAVLEGKLANEAVSTAKVQALAITTAKLAALAVTGEKIANLTITTAKIALLAITEALIADGAVTSRKAKLTAGTVLATADAAILNLGFKDITGTSKVITPAVASIIQITAVFEFFGEDHNAPFGQIECFGKINVDGEDGVQRAFFRQDFGADTEIAGASVAVTETRALSAGAHTIKLRANIVGAQVEAGNVESEGTEYTYLVMAS